MHVFKTTDYVNRALDGSALRQQVLSNNLANANTPNFQRSDVDFSSLFGPKISQLQLHTTHAEHTRNTSKNQNSPSVRRDSASTLRNDGNNVDIDREMVMLMENQLHYQAMADILNRNLSILRSVIGEGRR